MSKMNDKRNTLFAASGLYLLAAIGLWASSLLGMLLNPEWSYEGRNLAISLAYYLPFLTLPVILYTRGRGLRLNPLPFFSMLACVFAAVLSLMIVQDMQTLWMIPLQKLGLDVFALDTPAPANRYELLLSVIAAGILAPVGEELLFRGAMLSAWETRGQKRAVVTTAILFALLHGSVLGLPGEIFGGLMLGIIVIWTDSLYAGMAFHTVYNAGAIIMNFTSAGGAADAAEEALMHSDILAYIGGIPTVLVLILDILVMLALLAMVTRGLRMRYAFRCMMETVQRDPETAQKGFRFERGQIFKKEILDPTPMTLGAKILLALGLLSAMAMYALNLIAMLGGKA